MRRREFCAGLLAMLLGGTTMALPLSAHAQQTRKVPRIGVLWHAGNEEEEAPYLAALRRGFSDLGYVEGKGMCWSNALRMRSTRDSIAWPLISFRKRLTFL